VEAISSHSSSSMIRQRLLCALLAPLFFGKCASNPSPYLATTEVLCLALSVRPIKITFFLCPFKEVVCFVPPPPRFGPLPYQPDDFSDDPNPQPNTPFRMGITDLSWRPRSFPSGWSNSPTLITPECFLLSGHAPGFPLFSRESPPFLPLRMKRQWL